MDSQFSITNKTRGALPSVPFGHLKKKILGESYQLSLVFIGKDASRELNKKHRAKNKPTNVLSFPLSQKSGEIFITPAVVKKETMNFDMSYRKLVAFLFIHGLLHLKGMSHGSTMERAEKKWLATLQSE
jgi:probable rRNA maturation factor